MKQSPFYGSDGLGPAIPSASVTLAVSTTEVALPATIPPAAKGARITVHSNRVRFFYDLTAPTASLGHVGVVDQVIILETRLEVTGFLAIRESADAALCISYHFSPKRTGE